MKIYLVKILSLLCLVLSMKQAKAQLDSNINLLGKWSDDSIKFSVFYGNTYNEVWGFVQDDREYAVIGSTQGTHIIDVTEPASPTEVDFVKGALTGTRVVHRDYHDYNGYLYMVCGEGPSTMQIADLSYLPDSVHVVYDSDSLINLAHNIFIDSSSARLYGIEVHSEKTFNRSAGVRVLSLENSENPASLADYRTQSSCHDAYVRNDAVYLNIAHEGLKIMDFTNPVFPADISHLFFYPDVGYNHSGWLNKDGNIYVFADETPGSSIKICDVSALPEVKVLSTVQAPPDTSMAHNIMIKEDLLYISYYNEGLYVYNISVPTEPKLHARYDTYTADTCKSFCGAWGVYSFLPSGNILVSDMQTGLYVLGPVFDDPIDSFANFNVEIKIGPNPAIEDFTVFIKYNRNHTYQLKLYNTLGQEVMVTQEMTETTSISASKLESGTYLYRLFQDGAATLWSGKLQKE